MKSKRPVFVLKAAVSLLFLGILYRRVNIGTLFETLRQVQVPLLAVFFLILFGNTLLSATKWRILLRADGIQVSLPRLFVSYLIATFCNVFLPSTIGGDVYRVWDISRQSQRTVHTVASVFADRFSGFIALSSFGLLFPLLALPMLPNPWLLLLPAVFGGLLAIMLLMLWRPRLLRWVSVRLGERLENRINTFLDAFLASLRAYLRNSSNVARIMVISFVFQFCVIVAVYTLGRALGLPIGFWAYCVFVPIVLLMEALPISIYGLGLRDTGYVIFFTSMSLTRADAAAFSLLYVAASLIYAASGGICLLFARTRRDGHDQSPTKATAKSDA